MDRHYIERIIDHDLEKYLKMIGAVLIVGPKWCGKTTTGEQYAKSILKLQDPDNRESYLMWADIKPSKLLEGEKPLLIDEWQIAPVLWDAVRNSVDEMSEYGLYILTGSVVVDDSKIMHSGTGRIHRLLMKPMSLYESGESNGKISLMELFDHPEMDINGIESDLTMDGLIFAACRGGWPDSLNQKNREGKLMVASNYLDNLCDTDASKIDGVKRDSDKVRTILCSLARNNATLVKNKTLISDVRANYGDISESTFYSYIDVLKQLYVIEDLFGWAPNIRSKTAMRTGPKKVFIDPSIAVAALNLESDAFNTKDGLETFGFIFENLCIRDLSIYASSLKGHLKYYHDDTGLEVDCVLKLKDGRYALIECKLGRGKINEGAENLLKLKKLIEKNKKVRNPEFLAVITGGEIARTRQDGVKEIPIGCLR